MPMSVIRKAGLRSFHITVQCVAFWWLQQRILIRQGLDSSQWVRIPRSQFNAPIQHPQPACPFIIRDQKVIEFGGMSSLHREHQGHGSMPPSSHQPTCCIPKFFASPNVPIRKIEWSWLRSLPPPVVERLPRPCFNAHLWHLYLRTILQPACCIPQIFPSPGEKLLT